MFISDGIRTKLTNAHKFTIKEYADAGCIKRLNVPIKNTINKETIEVYKYLKRKKLHHHNYFFFSLIFH